MEEFYKSLKEDFERARAFWILNNLDLIEGYLKVKYTFLAYLQMGLYCLTLPYQFVRILVQSIIHDGSGRRGSNPRPSAWKADALPTELLPQFGPIFQRGMQNITFGDLPYRLLIIFSASSAEIGENRLKVFPSLSITSSNMVLGLTHTPRSPYIA